MLSYLVKLLPQLKDSALKRAPVLHALVTAEGSDEKDEDVSISDAGKKFHIKRTLGDNVPTLKRLKIKCRSKLRKERDNSPPQGRAAAASSPTSTVPTAH